MMELPEYTSDEKERIEGTKHNCRYRKNCALCVIAVYALVLLNVWHSNTSLSYNYYYSHRERAKLVLEPTTTNTNYTDDDPLNASSLLTSTKPTLQSLPSTYYYEPENAPGWNLTAPPKTKKIPFALSIDYFQQVGSSLAREYAPKPISDFCVPTPNGRNRGRNTSHPFVYDNHPSGLFYVKVPKAASSTLAGINYRIAKLQGEKANNGFGVFCTHQENHIDGAGRVYGNRDPLSSFLWASVRDPAARAISRVFFTFISEHGKQPTDRMIKSFLHHKSFQWGTVSGGQGGFQLRYMTLDEIPDDQHWSMRTPEKVLRRDELEERVKDVVQDYDFVAVTERMDESLVTLQLLTGLNLGDLLITSSKVGGSYAMAHSKIAVEEVPCYQMQKSFVSPGVQQYLETDLWYAQNYGDYLLHAAANASLDRTIDMLGKERFEKALKKYKQAKMLVDDECASKAIFPCSNNGTNQYRASQDECYSFDEGCGYRCVDALLEREDWVEDIL